MKFITLLALVCTATAQDDPPTPEPVPVPFQRCSSEDAENKANPNRVEKCSSLAPCLRSDKPSNKLCSANESCGQWEWTAEGATDKTIMNGCILNQYCESTGNEWKNIKVTFNCPEGVNKSAIKMVASAAAALALVSQL